MALALAICLPGPRLSADTETVISHLEAGKWGKASKAVKRSLKALANRSVQPNEADLVGELSLLRAVVAAGAGKASEADWYWWLAQMFIDRPSDERVKAFGPAGAALLAMIRPIPEAKPVDLSDIDRAELIRTTKKREKGGRSVFAQNACRGSSGSVRFLTSSEDNRRLRTPRVDEDHPLTVRPICAFAVIESYRTKKYGWGAVNKMRERL